jgi:hypothetical protein
LPAELEQFLSAGEPPVVFTPGSAQRQAPSFFREAVEASRLLGRRALLLTRFDEQLPANLPDGVKHFHYVPFSQVLPRARWSTTAASGRRPRGWRQACRTSSCHSRTTSRTTRPDFAALGSAVRCRSRSFALRQ